MPAITRLPAPGGGHHARRGVPALGPLVFLLAVCLGLAGCFPAMKEMKREDREGPKPPNVVLVLADDLAQADINTHTLEHMPNVRALMDEGTTFDNSFVTSSLCCPSRATILRGQYVHNHGILHNQPPLGGSARFRISGGDTSTMATWAKERGYRTAFFGKYLNGYAGTYVPPGWDEWRALSGNFLSDALSENGRIVSYDADQYHLDDVLSEKASDYARRADRAEPPFYTADRPFLMWIGTKAPHQPATPAPRDAHAYPDVALPHPPGFDERDVSDKPDWIKDNPPLSPEQKGYMDELHRKRLQSMLAVDDMIGDLLESLRRSGELDNTYVFFTSDNGFHLGQHRLGAGKWTPYEEDVRVPLIVRGPGVPEGRILHHMVLNNDLAPTFADLEGARTPDFVDGRSLVPLLDDDPPPVEDWRKRFILEGVAERSGLAQPPFFTESTVAPLLTGDPLPNNWRRTSAASAQLSQEWGRPWMKALRTKDYLYVEYKTGEHELYDLRTDPYELRNVYESASPVLKQRLRSRLNELRKCASEDCRAAEGGGPEVGAPQTGQQKDS
jgi:N-acetylglucosamine-6-sulfatase